MIVLNKSYEGVVLNGQFLIILQEIDTISSKNNHNIFVVCAFHLQLIMNTVVFDNKRINVTSFSSIPYYRNLRLISKTDLVRNFQSIVNQKSMFHLKLPPPSLHFKSNINSKEHLIKSF